MKDQLPTVVFTGGGTAGHVFPGLAVIEALEERFPADYVWLGSSQGPERRYAEEAGLPFYGIPAGKLRRYFDLKNLWDLFKIAAGFFVSLILLAKLRPRFLFSKGGFVSVPPVWAAGLLQIPVFSHESDLDPGLATRLNYVFTRRQYAAYEASRLHFPPSVRNHLKIVGNPVRRALFEGNRQRGRAKYQIRDSQVLVVVMGGSQGAAQINRLVWAALPVLADRLVWVHQTGPVGEVPAAAANYHSAPFFTKTELADLLAAADLLVGRAGAGTLWDMAAWSLPGLLVPLAAGSRGDQVRNARLFAEAGAAEVLEDPTDQDFQSALASLLDDPQRRKALSAALSAFPARDSAAAICEDILETLDV